MRIESAILVESTPQVGQEQFTGDRFPIGQEHLKISARSTHPDPTHLDPTPSHDNPLVSDPIDGFLLLGLLQDLKFRHSPRRSPDQWGFNHGLNKAHLTTPVRPGQRIQVHSTLLDACRRGDGGLVATGNNLDVECRNRPAMVAPRLSPWHAGTHQ